MRSVLSRRRLDMRSGCCGFRVRTPNSTNLIIVKIGSIKIYRYTKEKLTLVIVFKNLTPLYEIDNIISGKALGSFVDFFNFCIDFCVDSLPLNSLTIVEPKY